MQLMYFNLPPTPLSSSVVNCGPLSCLPPSPGGWQALQRPLFKPGLNEGPGPRRQVSILCGEEGWAVQGPGTTLRPAQECQAGTLIDLPVLLGGKGEGRRRQMGAQCWSLTSSVACFCDGLPGRIWSVFSQPWFQREVGAHPAFSLLWAEELRAVVVPWGALPG